MYCTMCNAICMAAHGSGSFLSIALWYLCVDSPLQVVVHPTPDGFWGF